MSQLTWYSNTSTFFHQVWQFFNDTTESELTRWKYEFTSDERIGILKHEENYDMVLTHFCDSLPLRDIPVTTGVQGKCAVCRSYSQGCPANGADIGFANGASPHMMLGSGLNCMPRARCVPPSWLENLEALFNKQSKIVRKVDLYLPDACNMTYVERDTQTGHVLMYMMYRYGLYVDFLKQRDELTRANTTVLEIGAGWGGFAALIKHLLPKSRYIILDIPTSLPLQMSYMHHLGLRNIVTLQKDTTSADVAKLLCCTDFDVLFILPHQIRLLPDCAIDLTVNLDSMVEMPAAAIEHYFKHISRASLTFYGNNREGRHNGWPVFRHAVNRHLVNHRWRLVDERRAPYKLPGSRHSEKWDDHVMMLGRHTDLLVRRSDCESAQVHL